jgi:hypothetical protein
MNLHELGRDDLLVIYGVKIHILPRRLLLQSATTRGTSREQIRRG